MDHAVRVHIFNRPFSDEPTKSTEYTSRAVNTGILFYCLVCDWMSEMNEKLLMMMVIPETSRAH